jgi:sigma-B regulation protein RsbU (phosphoserine phosphatase)
MGGDYYDFIVLSNDEMWIAIGDVSGKGLPAAEYTAMVKYVLRSYLLEYRSPARALSLTNLALSAQMRPEAFITLFCGLINVPGRTIKYAGAGHPYPILLSPEGEISELKTEGVAAAMFSDASYVEKEAQLRPGDTLILYTDGLSEARLGMAMYEERRLWEAVRECAGMSARDTANHLAEDVQAFTAGRLQDDIAIVVVQIAQQ